MTTLRQGGSTLRSAARDAVETSLHQIREHPFIRQANSQHVSRDQAERWIKCAGRESRSFPQILENLVARSSNPRIREILAENLDDEYGNGNPEQAHFKHYLYLLDELGIPRAEFEAYKERNGINLAVSLAYNISMQNDEALAIGYMLVNEGMTPITYAAAENALRRYHPDMQTAFFALHVEIDEKHVEDLYNAVEELDPAQRDSLMFGISIGERGMAVLLDEALGVFDYCDVPAPAAKAL